MTIEKLFQELATTLQGALPGSTISRNESDTVIVVRRHGDFYLKVEVTYHVGSNDLPKVIASFERMGPNTVLLASEVLTLHRAAMEAELASGAAQKIILAKWPND